MPESGLQVGVGDFFDGHVVHKLQVLSLLLLLEFGDGMLTMIDGQPVDQFLIIIEILVGDFDSSLQGQNFVLLALAGFENGLQGGFALLQLLHFLLITSYLACAS